MPVGRQQLHRLQSERADQDECGNQDQALGIGQAERKSDKGERGEMLEMREVARTGRSSIGDSVAYTMKASASQPAMVDTL